MVDKLNDSDAIKKAVDERVKAEEAESNKNKAETEEEEKASPYFVDDGFLCRYKKTRDGELKIKLCNFQAAITEENILDNGQETKNFYTLEGQLLHNGHSLPKIEIPANSFSGMTWAHQYGTRAVLEPGQTVKDYVRHSIQVSSGNVRTKTHFAHTGWRNINGENLYLHAAGAIGNGSGEDISVKLPKELQRYALPPPPPKNSEQEKKVLEASLSFLDLADHSITMPIFCGIYLSALVSLLHPPPNFSLFLYGRSGSLKSTLAVLALAHFGDFTSIESLMNLNDSISSIEKRLFLIKDGLACCDDYHPASRRLDAQAMEAKVQMLIRNQSNRTARGRMNPDMTEKARYDPRGMLLFTGELLPTLESTLARVLVVDLPKGAIDKKGPKLSSLQRNSPLLASAMSSYIEWIRVHYETIVESFPDRFMYLREKAHQDGFHNKIPEQSAFLRFGLEMAMDFMTDHHIIPENRAAALIDECWNVLRELAAKQMQRIADDDPTRHFVDILAVLVAQNKVRIKHTKDGEDVGGGTVVIGYYDSLFLYLYPTATWHEVQVFCQKEDSHFPFSRNSFLTMLRDQKIIQPSPRGENTTFVKINGKSHRVMKIIDRVVYKTLLTSVTTTDEEINEGDI